MLFSVFVTIHLIACFLLIVVVLMQSSKGGGLPGALGGGGGQTLFGGREAATFLSKATTYLAVIFMITSLSLAFLSAGRGGSEHESALRKAARQQQWQTIVPEEQKDVDDILGQIPQSAEEGERKSGEAEKTEEPEK